MSYAPTDQPWVDDALCATEGLTVDDYFVDAGHVIDDDVLELCRRCPVRMACLDHAYDKGYPGGYFAGLSPGHRKRMTFEEARHFVLKDRPKRSQ